MSPEQDPLAELRGIHLPDPISCWPLAPGWWLVATLMIALIVIIVLWWRSGQVRRAALLELSFFEKQSTTDSEKINALTQLLRRYARHCFPQDNIVSLVGDEWLQFLDRHSSDSDFINGNGSVLALGPYQKTPAFDEAQLHTLTRAWIKKNKYRKRGNRQ